jgi:hypothetical protein
MGKQETEKKLNDGPSFPQDIPSHLWRAAWVGPEAHTKPLCFCLLFRPWDLLLPARRNRFQASSARGTTREIQKEPRTRGIHLRRVGGGSSSGSWPRGRGPPWPPLPPRRWRRPHRLRPRPPPRKTSGVSNRDAPSFLAVLAYRRLVASGAGGLIF